MDERLVVVVGYAGAELLDIACVTSSLDAANRVGAVPPYRTILATAGGGDVSCDSGLTLRSGQSIERLNTTIDTLVVSGGLGHEHAAADARLVAHVRRLAALSKRVASVCTGATVLAATGLLDRRRVTTHWSYARRLAECYPNLTVDPTPIFIRDGNVATSGGVTSALDLTLHLIAEDHGPELARWVSLGMVTYLQRPGNQAQMSMFTAAPRPEHRLVRAIIDHILSNLDGDLTGATLASRAGVSERHLGRLFVKHAGQTPGTYVRHARLEAAVHLLTSTDQPLSGIARRSGFRTAESFRQAFVARYGIPPSRFRIAHSTQHSRPQVTAG